MDVLFIQLREGGGGVCVQCASNRGERIMGKQRASLPLSMLLYTSRLLLSHREKTEWMPSFWHFGSGLLIFLQCFFCFILWRQLSLHLGCKQHLKHGRHAPRLGKVFQIFSWGPAQSRRDRSDFSHQVAMKQVGNMNYCWVSLLIF